MTSHVMPRIAQPTSAREQDRGRWDLLETLFVLSAFIAPLNLRIVRAFTAYDMITALIAFLIIAGPRRLRSIPSSLRLAALFLGLAGLVSAFRSTYPLEAVHQVLQYAFVFLVQLPVILTLARSRAIVHAALMAFILGYLVVVVMSALLEQDLSAGRVVPFYNDGNPNALAIPTVFLVPFVVYFALDQWRKGRRLSVLAATGAALYLLLWALTASASRGATAATIVSLLLFVAFGRGLELWRVLARIGLVALFVTAAGAGVYWTSAFPDTLKSRIEGSIASEQDQRLSDERAALNRAGVQAFLESPLIGTGFDNFRYVAQFYDDEATFHDPHNLLIQFLAQTGLVGAAAVLFIFVRWFVLLVRTQSIAVTRSQRELLWAFVAGMAGLMIHSTVAPLILHRHYWLLYGLGIAAAVQLPLETESAASGGPGGGTSTSGPRPRSASG